VLTRVAARVRRDLCDFWRFLTVRKRPAEGAAVHTEVIGEDSTNMASYQTAFQKFLHRPGDLRPDDIEALKHRDPWLAQAALKTWRLACHRAEFQRRHPTRVVRLATRVVKSDRSR
jgi:hypothetical protein